MYLHLKKRFSPTHTAVLRKPGRPFSIKNLRKTLADVRHYDYLTFDYTREKIQWRFTWWNRILIFLLQNKVLVKALVGIVLLILIVLLSYIVVVNLPRKHNPYDE